MSLVSCTMLIYLTVKKEGLLNHYQSRNTGQEAAALAEGKLVHVSEWTMGDIYEGITQGFSCLLYFSLPT